MWEEPVIVASGFALEYHYGPCYPYEVITEYMEYPWTEGEDDRY